VRPARELDVPLGIGADAIGLAQRFFTRALCFVPFRFVHGRGACKERSLIHKPPRSGDGLGSGRRDHFGSVERVVRLDLHCE
jgi:hypothetical protein